jgi:dolichol-phosphate mannosyltransferase
VLVVDDNSPDGTGAKADAMAKAEPRIHVLHRPAKEGLGKAYLAGFEWALSRPYRYVFEMDADSRTTRATCRRFLAEMDAGADMALGSRYIEGGGTVNWGIGRQIISKAAACTREPSWACPSRPHRRLQVLPPRDARGPGPGDGQSAGYGLLTC